MDAKELVKRNGDPNRALDKTRIHMETNSERDDWRDLSLTEKEKAVQ